jgi:phospho-N-acetylmuramoyl-pentapeptide-transferase
MGGVLICISILVPTLLWSDLSNPYVWLVMLSTLAFGAIGFADDYIKVVHRRNKGLTARRSWVAVSGERRRWRWRCCYDGAKGSYSTRLVVPFEAVPAGPGMGLDAAYSASALAGVCAVCGVS